MRHSAFTIVELLVAIALATTIIFTAFTAFRVAQGAISVGNRLAAENSLLRAGYAFGMREIDNWDGVRAATPAAFAPLGTAALNTIDHRPTEDWWHWPEVAAAAPPAPSWFSGAYVMPGLTGGEATAQFQECRGFYESSQIRETTLGAIGWYGYLSYSPYHALYTNRRSNGSNVWGGLNLSYWDLSRSEWLNHYTDFFNVTFHSPQHGSGRSNGGTSYPFGDQQVLYGALASSTANEALRTPLLDASIRPAHWPDLQVNVSHSISRGRIIHYVEVNAKSPVTDQLLSLHFRTWGTTLRGARINANIAGERAAISY